ncbi:tyrosine-type recombinase/integrase [archaeon]|nr:tyrosine-type recombinase/integrase [archaeon]
MDNIAKLELELKSRGMSEKTVKAYLYHTSSFLKHIRTEPSQEDIQKYFIKLAETIDPLTVNLRISAVKFFYLNVLKQEFDINFMKRPKRIPEVLTKEETIDILNQINNIKHRLLIETIYGCGLRVSEAATLKKKDLRFKEGIIYLRQAKGKKDRFVMLPKSISLRLESYIEARADKNPYVFDSGRGGRLTTSTIQKIMKNAVKKAGIKKNVHPHTLRHSYATHLLENGTDIRIIQRLLGHNDVRTTEIYTHISNAFIRTVNSPLDFLELEPKRTTDDKIHP